MMENTLDVLNRVLMLLDESREELEIAISDIRVKIENDAEIRTQIHLFIGR